MKYVPVEGHPSLVRDVTTGAIISKDRPTKKLTSEFNIMKDDINSLKTELSEIKHLLKKIVENAKY